MSQASTLTNKIIDYVYRQGGYAWRASSVGVFDKKIGSYRTAPKKGVSDVLAVYNGQLIAIEVKIGKDRLSDEQIGFLKNIEHAGGKSVVIKKIEDLDLWWKQNICI